MPWTAFLLCVSSVSYKPFKLEQETCKGRAVESKHWQDLLRTGISLGSEFWKATSAAYCYFQMLPEGEIKKQTRKPLTKPNWIIGMHCTWSNFCPILGSNNVGNEVASLNNLIFAVRLWGCPHVCTYASNLLYFHTIVFPKLVSKVEIKICHLSCWCIKYNPGMKNEDVSKTDKPTENVVIDLII